MIAAKRTAKKANLRIYIHCGPPDFTSATWTDNTDILASSLFTICLSASRLLTLREDTVLSSSAIDSNRAGSRSILVCRCAFQMVARSCSEKERSLAKTLAGTKNGTVLGREGLNTIAPQSTETYSRRAGARVCVRHAYISRRAKIRSGLGGSIVTVVVTYK